MLHSWSPAMSSTIEGSQQHAICEDCEDDEDADEEQDEDEEDDEFASEESEVSGEDPFPEATEESYEEEETVSEAEACCTRTPTRRRSSISGMVSDATKQNVLQHVHAGVAVAFGAHLKVPEQKPSVAEEHFTSAAKKLLGPLGKVNLGVDLRRARSEFNNLREMTARYQTIHHTFWSNLALAFWLGFWIALIGLPNYALTARVFVYGETEQTAKLRSLRNIDWEHYWCDLQENGMAKEDLENVTSCETQNALEKADFSTQAFLNVSRSPFGKICGYRPGRRYFRQFSKFWIGNAAGNYFPTMGGNKAIYAEPLNYTDEPILDFGAHCLHMCERSRNCTQWSWRDMTNGHIFGGICQFFNDSAIIDTRLAFNWQHWIGGSCQTKAKQDYFCPENVYGRMVNIAPLTSRPELRRWNRSYGPFHDESRENLWCGVLPEMWAATWPNVVQMVVFSVFGGTGTTLQLCWQGFIGTTCACLNVFIMSLIYPYGGKGHECTKAEIEEGECEEGDMVYKSAGYNKWIGWADTLGVLFLFMTSNSQINTIKFGMSWHFYFMMDFINPDTGRKVCRDKEKIVFGLICISEYWFVVLITTVLGCFFAALATFVPCPLFNSRKAFQEMISTMGTVSKIWEESVEYICGTERTAKRFHIEAKIDAISQMTMNVSSNLRAAWWESALLCRYEPRRQILLQFQHNLTDIVDILPAVKSCVLNEDFRGQHQDFCQAFHPQMQAMVSEGTALTELCLSATFEKKINTVMRQAILESSDHVKRLQQKLVQDYRAKCKKPSDDLADETIMVFSVSFTARKAADLAQLVLDWDQQGDKWRCYRGDNCLHLFKGCWQGLRNTWSPSRIFSRDHLTFASRNFVGIAVVFFLSLKLDGYVFTRYSAIMPSTLSLLISRYQSSAFTNNIHRLLGVLLGKVLPLLILSGLSLFNCGSSIRSVAAFFAIWVYVWVFMYMYFTSQTWSLVGCLIAGFGVYPLLTPCTDSLEGKLFSVRYCELGQISMALAVQLFVDFLLKRESAESAAVHELRRLLDWIFLGKGEKLSCLQAVMQSDVPALGEALNEAVVCLDHARSLVYEADPKNRIMAGPYTPFKISLYQGAVDILQGCVDNLTLFLMASKEWAENESVRDIDPDDGANPNMDMAMADDCATSAPLSVTEVIVGSSFLQRKKDRVQHTAQSVCEALQAILGHRIEARLENRSVDQLQSMPLIDFDISKEGMEAHWAEVGQRIRGDRERKQLTNHVQTRVQVASRAFRHFLEKLGQLHSLCLKAHLQ